MPISKKPRIRKIYKWMTYATHGRTHVNVRILIDIYPCAVCHTAINVYNVL